MPGALCGKESSSFILSMPGSASLPARVQDLRGFKKVSLNAGIPATVWTLCLRRKRCGCIIRTARIFNGTGIWTVLPGTYGVRIGTSADRTENALRKRQFLSCNNCVFTSMIGRRLFSARPIVSLYKRKERVMFRNRLFFHFYCPVVFFHTLSRGGIPYRPSRKCCFPAAFYMAIFRQDR